MNAGDQKDIYCISGLGADGRLFANLKLPSSYKLKVLSWISARENESIESYAGRMASVIRDESPVLLGVSFGGMIAVEIAKLIPTSQVILISSIKTRFEKPFYFRIGAFLNLNKIISLRPAKFLEPFENYNLGVKTADDRKLAHEYHRNFDVKFGSWAVDRILHWRNEIIPSNIFHIHGSADRILPVRYVKPDVVIRGGGHLMVFNRAGEISELVVSQISGK